MRLVDCKAWKIQVLLTGLVLGLIVLTWQPVQSPDWHRFESQALSILDGQGYKTFGQPETYLPPGYPVFIAVVYVLGGSESSIPIIQAILLMVAVNLMYAALRPIDKRLATIGVFLMAAHPFIARMSSVYLSETLGVFLCAVLVFFLSRVWRKTASMPEYFFLGLVVMALPFNSPATLFLSAFVALSVTFRLIRKPGAIFLFLLGIMTLLFPWQVHCMSIEGKFCSTLYASDGIGPQSGYFHWYKSWAKRERDLKLAWGSPENIHSVPQVAFDSEAQREILLTKKANGAPDTEQQFGLLARERAQSNPYNYYFFLPLERSLNLWFDMNQLGHVQMEYVGRLSIGSLKKDSENLGLKRGMQRYLKASLSTVVYVYYISFPLILAATAALAVRRRELLPLLMFSAILMYTAISGYTGLIESRRNLVFIPIIVFLLVWRSELRVRLRGHSPESLK